MTAYLYQVVLAVQNKLEIHIMDLPWRLSDEDPKRVVDFVIASIGQQHDLKHAFDLMRYLLPTSRSNKIPQTRAICSTLIAQVFQSVLYPVVPEIQHVWSNDPMHIDCFAEIYRIHHHSLHTPPRFRHIALF